MHDKTAAVPPDWMVLERKRIAARRRVAGKGLVDAQGSPLLVGLALSGGGIRSATLSLGFLQALAKADVLDDIDVMSTVSGGGYAGGFLGALYMPEKRRLGDQQPASEAELLAAARAAVHRLTATEQRAESGAASDAAPISWLRDCGRYLAPNGGGDAWRGFTLWLRNLLAVHYVIGLSVLLVLMLLGCFNDLLWPLLQAKLGNRVPELPTWITPGVLYGLLALLALSTALLPLGIAYWYAEMPKGRGHGVWAGLLTDTAVIGMLMGPVLWFAWSSVTTEGQRGPGGWLACTLVLGSLWYVLGWLRSCWVAREGTPAARMLVTRTRLTRWLSAALSVTLILAGLGVVLIACSAALGWLLDHPHLAVSGAGIVSGVLAVWKLVPSRFTPTERELAVQWGPLVGAVVLGALLVLVWGMRAAWWLQASGLVVLLLAGLLILALVTGWSFQFLNLSTIQNLYTARLVRAYLGASNWVRQREPGEKDQTEPHAKDDMSLDQYHGVWDKHGQVQLASLAPLHLINVTINETVAARGSLVNQDRKGLPLTVTPDGYLINGQYQARHDRAPRGSPSMELLSVGRWIGVSGAACAPGLGRGTRPELALLLVLANARLGYWWKARWAGAAVRTPWQHLPFSTQIHLYREMRASFRGTNDSHWYLSDGGHLENTGVYALLLRRMDFILALDNGADDSYRFDDIANLMRLAAVDLGARFTPITAASLEPRLKGGSAAALLDLLGDPNGFARDSGEKAQFLLAYRVDMPAAHGQPAHVATVLWVKPRLTAQASLDLRQYQVVHPSFPQETTSDQFFDDEQWESYRQLGELAGRTLLDATTSPARLSGVVTALRG
ncbi:MAG: patatin-like phospholipase family protein [Burkholderiaceae bacterium]